MKFCSRSGERLDVSFDEIKHRIARLCTPEELEELDVDLVVVNTIKRLPDDERLITARTVDDLSARECASLQSVHPLYDSLAAKITASNLAKTVRALLLEQGLPRTFSGKVAYVARACPGALSESFVDFVAAHAREFDVLPVYERDATHSYFSLRTLERGYLFRVGDVCVESPQDMWLRVAVAVHLPGEADAADGEVLRDIARTYDHLSRGEYTHATPTLFNAGTGRNLASCYLLGTEDSLAAIFKTVSDAAQISKWAGGIGVHVTNVRAKGARIRSSGGTSGGTVPLLQVLNATARYCDQEGKRKGSIAAYLEPWHPDVFEFAELRKNTGAETERARDLFLALWVPDEFMKRLLGDEDWHLLPPEACPGLVDAVGEDFSALYARYVAEGRVVRVVKARALWQHVLECQLETGTPYVLFKDHVNRKSNHRNVGTVRSSNLCAEIVQYSDAGEYGVCNLASIAVGRFVRPDPATGALGVDHARLHAVAKLAARNLNRVIDVNGYPTPEARRSNLSLRPIGIGLQGLGDAYCMLGLPYDDPRALALDAEVMETVYHGALEASAELAEAHGPYERFDGSPASRGLLQPDLWRAEGADVRESGRYDWAALRERVRASGLRNSLVTALMPTASTSQILGSSESFEPVHSNVFKRTTLAGEFLCVNRHLMRELMARGLWTPELRRQLLAADGSVQRIAAVPDDLKAVFKTVWEVPLRSIVEHAAARGPYVDQSQSMNLYMATPSFQRLSSALIHGWRLGLKTGMYYLRSLAAAEAIKYGIAAGSAAGSAPACRRTGDPDCEACSA